MLDFLVQKIGFRTRGRPDVSKTCFFELLDCQRGATFHDLCVQLKVEDFILSPASPRALFAQIFNQNIQNFN